MALIDFLLDNNDSFSIKSRLKKFGETLDSVNDHVRYGQRGQLTIMDHFALFKDRKEYIKLSESKIGYLLGSVSKEKAHPRLQKEIANQTSLGFDIVFRFFAQLPIVAVAKCYYAFKSLLAALCSPYLFKKYGVDKTVDAITGPLTNAVGTGLWGLLLPVGVLIRIISKSINALVHFCKTHFDKKTKVSDAAKSNGTGPSNEPKIEHRYAPDAVASPHVASYEEREEDSFRHNPDEGGVFSPS